MIIKAKFFNELNTSELYELLKVRAAVFIVEQNCVYQDLDDKDSVIYPVDTYDLVFDDSKEAESLLNDYKNKITIKDFNGSETLSAAKHLLCARCGEVGFIVGGDEIVVVGEKGKYTGEEIETASKKWWEYWKDYWKLRKTKEAYLEDYACEITIPVDKNDPKGNW